MISHHDRVAADSAAGRSQRLPLRLAAGEFPLFAIVLCCLLSSAGCSMAKRNEASSRPNPAASTAAEPEGPPAVAPPRRASAVAADRGAWARHSKAGRENLALGNNRQAEDEFVAALRVSGAYGPATQRQATSLANLERVAARYESSPVDMIRITRVILPAAIQIRGRSDASVAHHSYTLGRALVANGQIEEARAPLQQALTIYQKRDDSLEIAAVHLQLSELERASGDLAAAEVEVQKALEMEERVVGPDDPALATTLLRYAALQAESGEFDEAEAKLLRANELTASEGGMSQIIALNDLAWFYTQHGRAPEAEPLALRAVQLLPGQNAPRIQIAAVLDTLGVCLLQQGKYEEAEVALDRGFKLSGGQFSPPFDSIQKNYAQLLRETNREEEAASVEAGLPPSAASAEATPAAVSPAPRLPITESEGPAPEDPAAGAIATVEEDG